MILRKAILLYTFVWGGNFCWPMGGSEGSGAISYDYAREIVADSPYVTLFDDLPSIVSYSDDKLEIIDGAPDGGNIISLDEQNHLHNVLLGRSSVVEPGQMVGKVRCSERTATALMLFLKQYDANSIPLGDKDRSILVSNLVYALLTHKEELFLEIFNELCIARCFLQDEKDKQLFAAIMTLLLVKAVEFDNVEAIETILKAFRRFCLDIESIFNAARNLKIRLSMLKMLLSIISKENIKLSSVLIEVLFSKLILYSPRNSMQQAERKRLILVFLQNDSLMSGIGIELLEKVYSEIDDISLRIKLDALISDKKGHQRLSIRQYF